jgi:hypothetical protein
MSFPAMGLSTKSPSKWALLMWSWVLCRGSLERQDPQDG